MEKIIYNKNNLSEKDVTDYVQKVKLLIFNKENQMLLVYAHNDFEFPGGTVEPNENLIDTINREIEEELGIKLNLVSLESFAQSIGYYKDWPENGRNLSSLRPGQRPGHRSHHSFLPFWGLGVHGSPGTLQHHRPPLVWFYLSQHFRRSAVRSLLCLASLPAGQSPMD